jgi:hypothetical protein
MMAKGRKPAIDGLARPQGILDDVVYPLVQKAARKVANKTITGTSKKSYRAYVRAAGVEDAMRLKRAKSYRQKHEKAFSKLEKSVAKGKYNARQSVKSNAQWVKSFETDMGATGGKVRREAQKARKQVRAEQRRRGIR